MTYQEMIDNIRDLGFSDDAEMEEFAETGLLYTGINRAITELSLGGFPNYATHEFEVAGDETGYLYLVMPEIDEMFLDFKDIPVLYSTIRPVKEDGVETTKTTQMYTKFNDYEIESENTLVINLDTINANIGAENKAEYKQNFRVFYIADHVPMDSETDLTTEIPLPRKAHHLAPLLAAYYIWLDDDSTKAVMYYNAYTERRAALEANSESNKIRIKVLPGGM